MTGVDVSRFNDSAYQVLLRRHGRARDGCLGQKPHLVHRFQTIQHRMQPVGGFRR